MVTLNGRFYNELPVVAGKDAILVVCDRLSKMTHFVATMEGTSAEGLADFSGTTCGSYMGYQKVWCQIGDLSLQQN